jgi:hypothetical protein
MQPLCRSDTVEKATKELGQTMAWIADFLGMSDYEWSLGLVQAIAPRIDPAQGNAPYTETDLEIAGVARWTDMKIVRLQVSVVYFIVRHILISLHRPEDCLLKT